MKRREFLAGLGTACLLGLSMGVGGCTGLNTGSEVSSGTGTTDTSTTGSGSGSSGSSGTGSSLARTCPKGKSCRSPDCPQWSDVNQNGTCDRGYAES